MTPIQPTARQLVADALAQALEAAIAAGELPAEARLPAKVEEPRDARHGDFATNLAMTLAKPARRSPLQLAQLLAARLPTGKLLSRVEVAPPGFINLTLHPGWLADNVAYILAAGREYGRVELGGGRRVLLEYVSANPTGPLHVGHGRWAAIGSTLANLMNLAGYHLDQEFYINDAGNQMQNLGRSVLYRLEGRPIPEGEAAKEFYSGRSIQEVADAARAQIGAELADLDEAAKTRRLTDFARDYYLADQKATLGRLHVHFDSWYSERTLHAKGEIDKALEVLEQHGDLYVQDGARWFASTRYGDDKDRVVVRENGVTTYLAADIAYHWDKLDRGYQSLINIWGADHHGYVARMKAAVQAMGHPPEALEVVLGQLVSLFSAGEPVPMSKRTGEMVTLAEVIDEVGPDAARYFLLMRSPDTPLDFDLELAKQQTADNPVFYVQYAHARLCSILRHAAEAGFELAPDSQLDLSRLDHPHEHALMLKLAAFPDEIARAALAREPHRIARFAQELAADFHQFYTTCRVLDAAEPAQTKARLALAQASRITLANALENVLGVSAPERM